VEYAATVRKRPDGLVLICVGLAWVGVGGFGNALIWDDPNVQAALQQMTPGLRLGTAPFKAFMAIYGALALLSCVTVWLRVRWGRVAYALWLVSLVAAGLAVVLPSTGQWAVIALAVTVASTAVAGVLYPYIARHTS